MKLQGRTKRSVRTQRRKLENVSKNCKGLGALPRIHAYRDLVVIGSRIEGALLVLGRDETGQDERFQQLFNEAHLEIRHDEKVKRSLYRSAASDG